MGPVLKGGSLNNWDRRFSGSGFEGWDRGFPVTGQLVIHRAFVMLSPVF